MYRKAKENSESSFRAAPSFYLTVARRFLLEGDVWTGIRVVTNCLELNIQDVQMLRSVGYFLLSAGATSFACSVFDRVIDLAPAEPQSFLDACLVRLHRLQTWATPEVTAAQPGHASRVFYDDLGSMDVAQEFSQAQQHAAHVITHAWAERFAEVEWPALILLHWLELFARERTDLEAWPWQQPEPAAARAEEGKGKADGDSGARSILDASSPLADDALLSEVHCE